MLAFPLSLEHFVAWEILARFLIRYETHILSFASLFLVLFLPNACVVYRRILRQSLGRKERPSAEQLKLINACVVTGDTHSRKSDRVGEPAISIVRTKGDAINLLSRLEHGARVSPTLRVWRNPMALLTRGPLGLL